MAHGTDEPPDMFTGSAGAAARGTRTPGSGIPTEWR